ncbi:MAG: ABC transporter permease [Pseudonocardia sp.]|uniref:ABC transporter permease n=1 Tax=unclassified Pseudonocardia TaxID=2619320 RepID=UPI00086C1DDB|nr:MULTISPECIES: ABC transporter permease [unclassified Pseudonocardia]MBN9111678.1 ABC transporter permease [Pseudonocardia sp.]ODU28620.1 MAG: ABC transporter permease [Pseudonocardia sp. SCN 72-51]ODV02267.1 MAG: ABC transporter permease [Pseudonocardia sp. SCN 73-27]
MKGVSALVGALVTVVVVLGAWTVATAAGVSALVLPPLGSVAAAFVTLVRAPVTWAQVGVTATEIVGGFGIALVAGIVVGVALGRLRWLEQAARPALVAFQVIPKVALVPIFVLWFGFGPTSKIVLAALLAFLPITMNVLLGVRSVEPGHRDVLRQLGASRRQVLRSLDLPTAAPAVLTGAETAIVFAVIGAVIGEFLGGSQGLGHVVVVAMNSLDTPRMFAAIVLLALLGITLHGMVAGARRVLVPWHTSA